MSASVDKSRSHGTSPRRLLGSGVLFLAGCTLSGATGPAPSELPPLSRLQELFWALILLVGFTLAGVVWLGLIRRRLRFERTALQQREAAFDAWYRDLFENAHDILFALDPDGRLASLNRAGKQVLGYPADGAQPLLPDLVTARDRPIVETLLRQLREGHGAGHGEFELVTQDGRRVVLRVNLRRQDLPGHGPRIQGLAWDVTEQRRAEEALRESEHRLRHSLEERIRIGRDLHDGIIQSIYAVGLGLGECRRLLATHPEIARQHLERSVADLNAVIRDVRRFIGGLEPDALKGREFETALQGIVDSLGRNRAVDLQVLVDPDAANSLSARQAEDLLQIAREAVSNALRHSGCQQLQIQLAAAPDGGTRLEIRDDGSGLPADARSSGGLGLRNIDARARNLGARQEFISAPDNGTVIRIDLPKEPARESP